MASRSSDQNIEGLLSVKPGTVGDEIVRLGDTAVPSYDPTERVYQVYDQTVDGNEKTMWSIDTRAGDLYQAVSLIEAHVVSCRNGVGDQEGGAWVVRAAFSSYTAASTQLGATEVENDVAGAMRTGVNMLATIDFSGGLARLRIKGDAGNTHDWHATIRIWAVRRGRP
ncbi:hypothetical protein LCGC14_1550390 [marine sediment metagenome]|uniref:Uncharacterized protein n=1 Tax=marine sediment metagenome TaxID=412755 RepID=A0A0F9LR92_9ZZZZ